MPPRHARALRQSLSATSHGTGSTRRTPRSSATHRASSRRSEMRIGSARRRCGCRCTAASRRSSTSRTSRSSRGVRRATRADTRRLLSIRGDRPFVLASFGGYGLDLPFDVDRQREGSRDLVASRRRPPRSSLPGSGRRRRRRRHEARATASCPSAWPTARRCSTRRAATSFSTHCFRRGNAAPAPLPLHAAGGSTVRTLARTTSTRCSRKPPARTRAHRRG